MLSFKNLLGLAGRRLRGVSAPSPAPIGRPPAAPPRITLADVRLASLGILLDQVNRDPGSRGDRA